MAVEQIGPYTILEELGKGGIGIVYLGLHTKLEQKVAIKVLSPEFSRDEAMRERFIREAKLQAQLSHANAVNILNYLEDGTNIYLVMEYVAGRTLEEELNYRRALTLSECVRVMDEVLAALEFMHGRGVIHRDIKPANIMLTENGQVKVTDFGIAKVIGKEGMTKAGAQLGTVWYMSPEQISGREVDQATDIYALGITLYQMATGKVPFSSGSEYNIMRAHVEKRPAAPNTINADIPKALNNIILKAIAKNPKKRFASASEFRRAIQALSPGRTVLSGAPTSAQASPDNDKKINIEKLKEWLKGLKISGGRSEDKRIGDRFSSRQIILWIGALVILIGLLGILYLLFTSDSGGKRNIPLVEENKSSMSSSGQYAKMDTPMPGSEVPPDEPLPKELLPTEEELGLEGPEDKQGDHNEENNPANPDHSSPNEGEPHEEPSNDHQPESPQTEPDTPKGEPDGQKSIQKGEDPNLSSGSSTAKTGGKIHSYSPSINRYARELRSSDPGVKRNAAKIVYKKYIRNKYLVSIVNEELLKGYRKNTRSRHHVDTMAWFCNVLGGSKRKQYLSTLREVKERAKNEKIKKYAEKNLRKLSKS